MHKSERTAMHRARLFSALLDMDKRQGGWDKVFQLLNEGQRAAESAQLPELVAQLEQGQTVVLEGLKNTKKFYPWELRILELGLASGSITESYGRLREHYLLQQQFVIDLKKQLVWPLLIVALALAILLSWAAYSSLISIPGLVMRLVLLTAGSGLLMLFLQQGVRQYRAGLLPTPIDTVLQKLPGINALLKSAQTFHYFKNLQQCTDNGVPLTQALKIAARKIPNESYVPAYLEVLEAVADGRKLSAALSASGLLSGITLPPLSPANATAASAQAYLSEAAYHSYIEHLWFWVQYAPSFCYACLPPLAFAFLVSF